MNPAKVESDVPRSTTDEQGVGTIETGDGLELKDQQSYKPQGSGQAGPVDKESLLLTEQQTGEPQNSSHIGPGLTDQLIGKQQNRELICPDDKEGSGQVDPQTDEPKCSGSSITIVTESPGLRDLGSGGTQGNEHAGLEDKASSDLTDGEPEGSDLSSSDKGGQGLTDNMSSESQGMGLYGQNTRESILNDEKI